MFIDRQVKRQVILDSTPEMAFEAVTKASELREWMCDEARTEVRPGGPYEVRWRSGYRAEGQFTELAPPHRAAFTWLGSGELGQTHVEFRLEPVADGVEMTLVHSGFGPGPEWSQALAEAEDGWAGGLENLKSTLETGIDLRWVRQPFLGIHFDILDALRAARDGIAALAGIYVDDTVEGGGARAAGLGKGDVIVAIDDVDTPTEAELAQVLRAHRAGDVVEVHLVRGQAQETVRVTLGQRAVPDLPATAEALAETLAAQYRETDAALQAALEGVTEDEAGRRPAEGDWSIKEILAHLSINERDQQSYLGIFALDGWLDTGPTNPTVMAGRLAATLSVTHTLPGLLDRFLADEAETVAFVRGLPAETAAYKARFRRIAQNMLYLTPHTESHVEQIKATIAAVRK